MRVEIADIKSSKTFKVDGDSVIGRDGADNDIPVNDPKISGRHARLFVSEGKWFLEDLGSSNGTFVNGKRIKDPVEINEGMKFSLCEHLFGVVALEADDEPTAMLDASEMIGEEPTSLNQGLAPVEEEPTAIEDSALGKESTMSVGEVAPVPKLDRAPGEPVKMPGAMDTTDPELEDELTPEPEEPGTGSIPGRKPTGRRNGNGSKAGKRVEVKPRKTKLRSAGEDEPLLGYLLRTVPRAFAYYLATVPVLLFNPIGTVRKSISEQKFEAFGPRALTAYALPSLLLGVLLGSLVGIILAIVNGQFGFGTILSPLIQTGVAIVVAIVTGFIFHPVLRWLVNLLKGTSDNVSRTNYFVTLYAALPLQTLASGVAALVAIIPVPFIGVLPPLLTLAASLIVLYVSYAWFRAFRVAKWVPIVFLVLMALSAIGVAFTMIGAVTTGIAQLSGDGTPAATGSGVVRVEGPDGATVTTPAAEAAAARVREVEAQIEELRSNGQLTPDIEAALREQVAAAAAGGASDVVEITPSDDGPVPTPKPTPGDIAGTGTSIQSRYQEYQRRRKTIETAIKKDPTLIKRPGVKPLYQKLTAESIRIKQQHKVKLPKRPTPEQTADAKIKGLERDTALYEGTVAVVDELYDLLFED